MSGEGRECDCDYWYSKHRWHCSTNHPPADTASTGADVEALGTFLAGLVDGAVDELAQEIATSDWLAAHDAATADRVRRETEEHWAKVTVMRDGAAIREAAERAWDEGWTYAFDDHGPMNGNPYRRARIAREQGR
jgi:hypothetical protein